jgi:hypothetical protein
VSVCCIIQQIGWLWASADQRTLGVTFDSRGYARVLVSSADFREVARGEAAKEGVLVALFDVAATLGTKEVTLGRPDEGV